MTEAFICQFFPCRFDDRVESLISSLFHTEATCSISRGLKVIIMIFRLTVLPRTGRLAAECCPFLEIPAILQN